ncbi:hypothetical protein VTO58DRAFT_103262 [Aureobasidium pullulans]|nr:hypothetical protein JADG_004482 [Aureobasidium pullulans]
MAMNMHVALPLYIYPSSGAWQSLYDAVTNNPNVTFDVIINPNSGPGGSPPDSNYIAGVSKMNSYSNVNMVGYVHTSYGDRALSDIEADIDTYQSWSTYSNANIALKGIFVDETPASYNDYDYMNTIYNKVKNTMTHGNLVWTNPGVPVDSSFYNIADMINAYENTYDDWINNGGNTSIPVPLRSQSTVLIHSYPDNTNTLMSDVDGLVDAPYYGALVIVNDQYSSFDDLWSTYTSEVGQSNADMVKCK